MRRKCICREAAYLCLPDIRDPEHELQRSVAPGDDRAVADKHRARSILGVRNARKDHPQGYCIQQLPEDDLQRH